MRYVYSAEVLRSRWLDDFSDTFFKIESDYVAKGKIALGHACWRAFKMVVKALQCKRLSSYSRANIVCILDSLDSLDLSPVLNEQILLFRRDVMLRR